MMYGPQHIYINAKKRRVHKRDKRKLLEEGFKIDKYEVEACVGRGGFGDIYGVKVADSNKILALKLEPVEGKSNLLKEIEFLKRLQDSLNFPIYYDDGVTDQYRYLVMELLGPSLSSTRREMKHCHFSLSTTLRIGIKMLRCLEQVHKHGIIHCDVKPGNFLLRPDCLHSLVLVDFGLAQFYIHHKTGKHKKFKIYNGFNGTMKYASLNSMNESSLSRRDDLYSWFYSLYEMMTGKLPWEGKEKLEMMKMKFEFPDSKFFKNFPPEFSDLYRYLCKLEFDEEPNYDWIVDVIMMVLSRLKISFLDPFDWEKLSEREVICFSPIAELPKASWYRIENPKPILSRPGHAIFKSERSELFMAAMLHV